MSSGLLRATGVAGGEPGLMLVELSVVEQRYHAVMEVLSGGVPVVEVAERYGVSRKMVHAWLRRYRQDGLPGLTERSHRPHHHPGQLAAEVEARVCELRRTHPRWGPRRLVHELRRLGLFRCRRGRRCIACWSATAWSLRCRVNAAGRITSAGSARGRCSCGNWMS